jgi:ketosteroid isomerase-like protein
MKGRIAMPNIQETTAAIIALESAALERWGNGDPSGFLEICAPDIVYFDPYLEMRIDGREALTQYYKTFWGQVRFDRFELLNPCVQVGSELAVLTFNYVSYAGDKSSRWNCTEVYRQVGDCWQIIQTHWSYTRHPGIVQN